MEPIEMKYAVPPRGRNSRLSTEPLRPNEIRYMHWKAKQIAKSVAAYKAAPKQHDEHCYTRRYFLFMRAHGMLKQFCEEYGLESQLWEEHARNIKDKTNRKRL